MKIRCLFVLLFLGTCVAKAYAATDRDLIIQKQLDCVSQERIIGVTWADVCSMPATSPAASAVVSAPQNNDVFSSRVNTFSLAEMSYYYHYFEPDKARKYTGIWNGAEGKYIFRPPQGNILNNPLLNFYALEGTYASGKSDKSGDLQRGNGSTQKLIEKNIPGYMFDLRALIGRDFELLSNLRLTPYVGWGERYKTDQSAGHFNELTDGTPEVGYDRSDLYYYIPIGLTTDLMVSKDYEISLNTEYDYLVKGWERDRFSDADQFLVPLDYGSSNKALFAQEHGFGAKFSLKFLKHFSLVDVFIEPFVDYWHIGKSKVTAIYVENTPVSATANKNSTAEVGVRLGVEF
jgi:hypothetical protein